MQSETIAQLSTFADHDGTQLSPDRTALGAAYGASEPHRIGQERSLNPESNIVSFKSNTTAIDHAGTQLELNLGGEMSADWLISSESADGVPLYSVNPKRDLSEEDYAQMYGWLTLQQVVTLTAAIVDEAGENLFSAAECDRAFEWADKSLVNYTLLQKVLDGSLQIRLREDGEPFFVLPKANTQPVCP